MLELKRYDVEVAALQETLWFGSAMNPPSAEALVVQVLLEAAYSVNHSWAAR